MTEPEQVRARFKDARRIVIKLGTSVVTTEEGYVALGRLGYICEQIAELHKQGYQVTLVSSGSVGVGRSFLRRQDMLHTSPRDMHRHIDRRRLEDGVDPRACAAAGQSRLMGIYNSYFDEFDIGCSQLLVTEADFANDILRKRISDTVDRLLAFHSIPIVNENDAVSTRAAPNSDSDGIFWDNDSLARLFATLIGADLLILLSDVKGLYSGPLSDPLSHRISTYNPKGDVTFGEKSRYGRGGMTMKVESAWMAACSGIPSVIGSGYASNVIRRIMAGEDVGTLFSTEVIHSAVDKIDRLQLAVSSARAASRTLATLTTAQREDALRRIASALEERAEEIYASNARDIAENRDLSPALAGRLKITPKKVATLAEGARALADMDEPIGRVLRRMELGSGLVLDQVTAPLGVVMVIFESRPDVLPQVVSLAIRSGNAIVLKGGKEASHSNQKLHDILVDAVAGAGVPAEAFPLIHTRADVDTLLGYDEFIDLVIPRGGNALVRHIQDNTRIAVLGHASGICHVYVDAESDVDNAIKIVIDAKTDYPTACNAMETLILHEDVVKDGRGQRILDALTAAGVKVHSPKRYCLLYGWEYDQPPSLSHEYSELACTVVVVGSLEEAVEHIHEYGSGHTESIVTSSEETGARFHALVDSACVFVNASTRFSDGFRFGLGCEVGISTNRIHARGPVGVDGLLTTRWLLSGHNDTVSEFSQGTKSYTHKLVSLEGGGASIRASL